MKHDVRYRFLEFRYISPSVIYGQAIYLSWKIVCSISCSYHKFIMYMYYNSLVD